MDKLSTGKTMTTREVAEALGTSVKVVLENAKKCLLSKKIENGKPTFWTEEEITVLLEQMKNPKPNHTFTGSVKVASTELTPALMIKQAMELMQKGYELELERIRTENARLEQENSSLQADKEQLQNKAEKLQTTCAEQAHALEYSKAIGKTRWSEAKKLYGFKVNIAFIKKNFEKDVDWFSAIMGNDKYPTFWVSDKIINTLIEQE